MDESTEHSLRQYIRECLINERRLRERDDVELWSGDTVPYGSDKHVADLSRRIGELEMHRARQKRGSDSRANYTRLIQKLKAELRTLSQRSRMKQTKKR